MPDYLHRTNKSYLKSVSPASLPEPEVNYIKEPDLSAVAGEPSKYWIITGDVVTLMTVPEQAAADAAIDAANIAADREEAINRIDVDIITRETVEALLFEVNKINTRLQEVQDTFTDMKGTSTLAALRNQIPDPSLTTNPAPAEFTRINPKLRSQVLQTMVDDINAGIADPDG